MTTTTYRVLLNGPSGGQEIARVAAQLANLFKIPPEKVLPLLAKPGIAVKRGVDLQTAALYQAALEKAGCNCLVQPEVTQQETPATDRRELPAAANEGAAPIARSSPSPAPDVSDTALRVARKLENATTIVTSLFQNADSLWRKASRGRRALVIFAPLVLCAAVGGWVVSTKDRSALIASTSNSAVVASAVPLCQYK